MNDASDLKSESLYLNKTLSGNIESHQSENNNNDGQQHKYEQQYNSMLIRKNQKIDEDGFDHKNEIIEKCLTPEQLNNLKAQINVYKILARNEPITKAHLNQVYGRKADDWLPMAYEYPLDLGDGEKLPYDLQRVLMIHQQRASARSAPLTIPCGIDPQKILAERQNRILNKIKNNLFELDNLPENIDETLQLQCEIQQRSLRLLNLQTHVRQEVTAHMVIGTTFETALNPIAYRRTKRHAIHEARITEKLEKQLRFEQDQRRRQKHTEMMHAIVQAVKDFKEFHRNVQSKIARIKRAVVTYHTNSEIKRKKDELRNEKMRMMKLMEEDDFGYRQLLDEKKDKRLVFLLQQTDEYVESLTALVKQHQATEKKRKIDEKKEEKLALKRQRALAGETDNVIIRNCTTGEILKGDLVPKADEIAEWMEKNPGYEIISNSDSEDEVSDTEEFKPIIEEKKDDEFEGMDEEQRNRRIIEKARNEEDEYDQKTKSQMESYYATAHRIKEKIVKQHFTMGAGDPSLLLKPYQIKGLEWMVSLYNNNLNGILADEMGLGKTIQTISLVTYLMEVKKVNGPYLIIVPLSTISNWTLELVKWAPSILTIVYKGNKDNRKSLEGQIRKGAFNVLLTTYDFVLKERSVLSKIRWKYMIIDEGHRMKNHSCKLTISLNAYFHAQHRLLLTGTPLQNKLPELWALLNFLLPTIFKSCGTFEQWFNAPFSTTGEKVELSQEETMLIIRRLHKVLRPFLLRRLKKEVESQLPDKVEYVIKCDMSALQKILYKHLQKGVLIDSKHQRGKTLLNTIIHLRKLCNHPFLFPTVEEDCLQFWKEEITGKHLYRVAGKFELLDRILPKLKATNHRVLIFCQMTRLMNIMEDFFQYREWKYLRLDGNIKQEDRSNMLNEFNAPDSDYFVFMLSTRAGGLGLNLQTADTVIIFDSDWNPHQDMQAQDRAHRIGQTREVRVLRLITANSVEEKILAAARHKLNVDEKVIQAGKFDQRSTGAERKKMLEAIIRAENDENDENEVTEDAQLNEYLARSEEEIELFTQMDIDLRREEAKDKCRKPRLMEIDEIPTSTINQSKKFTEDEERGSNASDSMVEIFADIGRRKRKNVNYSHDLMSDREWLKTVVDAFNESDDEDEDDYHLKKKKEKRKNDESSDTPKRGRKKKRIVESDESDNEEQYQRSVKKKRLDSKDDQLQEIMNKAFVTLTKYKLSGGNELSEPFMQLPSRRELPDYYEVIDRPMDLNRIKKKIKEGRYLSLDEMSEDIELICSNAQKYNIEESDIFNDSVLLSAVWKRIYNKMKKEIDPSYNSPNNIKKKIKTEQSLSPKPIESTDNEALKEEDS